MISTAGGTGTRTYVITSGALPPVVMLNGNGAVTGTPTSPGVYNFTVQSTDANACVDTHAAMLVIAKGAQAITGFAANPAAPVFTPNGSFAVSATGGASISPVLFASTSPMVCTVAGNTVTMHGPGTCALTANQAGDANYSAAPQATLAVVIGAATQAITGFAANPAAPVFTPTARSPCRRAAVRRTTRCCSPRLRPWCARWRATR